MGGVGGGGCAAEQVVRCRSVCCFSPRSPVGSCWTRQIKWSDVSYPPAQVQAGEGSSTPRAAHPHGVTARRPPAAQPPVPPARCFEARSSAALAVATPLPPPAALRWHHDYNGAAQMPPEKGRPEHGNSGSITQHQRRKLRLQQKHKTQVRKLEGKQAGRRRRRGRCPPRGLVQVP